MSSFPFLNVQFRSNTYSKIEKKIIQVSVLSVMFVVSVRLLKLYCVTGELAVNDCLDGIHFK